MTVALSLLDASILLPLIMNAGKRIYDIVRPYSLSITTLTPYEACNGAWKMAVIHRLINEATAAMICDDVVYYSKKLPQWDITDQDVKEIMKKAVENHLTFYDASYLHIAKAKGLLLITRDKKLASTARNMGVKVSDGSELIKLSENTKKNNEDDNRV